MGLVTALRELWRFRLFVALVAVVAAAVGVLMTFHVAAPDKLETRQYHVGIASARALVDTPSSQVVDLGGKSGADIATLSTRANLLANLMTSSPLKDEIARRAGVPDNMLLTPAQAAPGASGKGSEVSGTIVSATDPRANILKTSVPALDSGEIPIIAVETQAPTADVAALLADQAIAVLQEHLETVAGDEAVPVKRRVIVRELGQAQSATVSRGPSRILTVVAVLFTLLVGCGTILAVGGLARMWRSVTELERDAVIAAARELAASAAEERGAEVAAESDEHVAARRERVAALKREIEADPEPEVAPTPEGVAEDEDDDDDAVAGRRHGGVAALRLLVGSRAGRDSR